MFKRDNPLAAMSPEQRAYAMQAAFLVAGEVGEAVLDTANYRRGTSIDEILLSQLIAAWCAENVGMASEERWRCVRNRTAAIIKYNETLARELGPVFS